MLHNREWRRAHPFRTAAVTPEDSERIRAGIRQHADVVLTDLARLAGNAGDSELMDAVRGALQKLNPGRNAKDEPVMQ